MSVVTEEALNVALITYHRTRPHEGAVVAMRSALAAVAPIIAKAERERCAGVAEAQAAAFSDPAYAGGPIGAFGELFACKQIAAALRALGDAT